MSRRRLRHYYLKSAQQSAPVAAYLDLQLGQFVQVLVHQQRPEDVILTERIYIFATHGRSKLPEVVQDGRRAERIFQGTAWNDGSGAFQVYVELWVCATNAEVRSIGRPSNNPGLCVANPIDKVTRIT